MAATMRACESLASHHSSIRPAFAVRAYQCVFRARRSNTQPRLHKPHLHGRVKMPLEMFQTQQLLKAIPSDNVEKLLKPSFDIDVTGDGVDLILLAFIVAGPLLKSVGLNESDVRNNFQTWLRLGRRLAQQLSFDHDQLTDIQRLRIYQYYLPIYFWVEAQLQQHRGKHSPGATPPLVVGISAPQGCGKTTIVEQLEQLFHWLGISTASVSIDDFYLTYADQSQLAATYADNKLLQYRGNAGTHDVALGVETLMQLRALTQNGSSAKVPRYTKSAYSGRGDRADVSTWPSVQGPLQLVLFEGWMLGFPAQREEQVAQVDPDLSEVNRRLREYKAAWDSHVDSWLVVRIGDPQWVYRWRLQAEERMRASGAAGLTDEQVADFVSRFMPAYRAYLPSLYSKGPTTAREGHTLVVEVDASRAPVATQPPPPILAA